MQISTVLFTAKEKAELCTENIERNLNPFEVLVKTEYDLISTGTELANYRGLPNTGTAGNNFPIRMGYSASGTVLDTGSEVKNLKPGDKVITAWQGHCSRMLFDARHNIMPIPDGISMQDAAAAHLCCFPLLAIRKLNIQLGEACLIAGQGLLGIFAGQLARIAGAYPVIVSDHSPYRRELALKLGADHAFDPADTDYINKVLEVTGGNGVECVVEVTGYINALQQALECVAFGGRIALLGCTRTSDQTIDFYKYVHRRGIQLLGCHTFARPNVDRTATGWSEKDDYATFFKLVQSGRLQVAPVITQVVSPRDCQQVFHELSTLKDPPLGNLFDWRDIDK